MSEMTSEEAFKAYEAIVREEKEDEEAENRHAREVREPLAKKIEEAKKALQELKKENDETLTVRSGLEAKTAATKRKKSLAIENIQRIQKLEHEAALAQIEEKETENSNLKDEQKDLLSKIKEKDTENANLKEEHATAIEEKETENSNLKKEQKDLQSKHQSALELIEEKGTENTNLKEEHATKVSGLKDDHKNEINALKKERDDALEADRAKGRELDVKNAEIEELQGKTRKGKAKLEYTKAEKDLMEKKGRKVEEYRKKKEEEKAAAQAASKKKADADWAKFQAELDAELAKERAAGPKKPRESLTPEKAKEQQSLLEEDNDTAPDPEPALDG